MIPHSRQAKILKYPLNGNFVLACNKKLIFSVWGNSDS